MKKLSRHSDSIMILDKIQAGEGETERQRQTEIAANKNKINIFLSKIQNEMKAVTGTAAIGLPDHKSIHRS